MSTHNKQRGQEKLARIPVKVVPLEKPLKKPDWIRISLPTSDKVEKLKGLLNQKRLHTVCEEAACPNLPECFSHGTATFMIMGDKCTRRCTFCDVAHGRPDPLDTDEPKHVAEAVKEMGLSYVVITSVDRDDLKDGGAHHFGACISAIRDLNRDIQIEILVPDFRGRMDKAMAAFGNITADVFNHNLETIPRLYKSVRPGSDYQWSLDLLQAHKTLHPQIPTKSGLMLGLGETDDEILAVLEDLRTHDVDMLTLGQYLQPSAHHHPVLRYVHPDTFKMLGEKAKALGFKHVASGPLVRSSYHADLQAKGDML